MTIRSIARKDSPYSPEELAAFHNVTATTVRRRCRDGVLPFFKVGKLYRFTPEVAHSEETRLALLSTDMDGEQSPYRSTVYFVGSECGPIKIGMALNVEKRLASLQASSPSILALLAVCHGGLRQEVAYHRQFREHRLHGEWFAPHPEILAEIERLRETN